MKQKKTSVCFVCCDCCSAWACAAYLLFALHEMPLFRRNFEYALKVYFVGRFTVRCANIVQTIYKQIKDTANIIHFASFGVVNTQTARMQPLHMSKKSTVQLHSDLMHRSIPHFVSFSMECNNVVQFSAAFCLHRFFPALSLFLQFVPSRFFCIFGWTFFPFVLVLIHFYFYTFDICYWYKCLIPQHIHSPEWIKYSW